MMQAWMVRRAGEPLEVLDLEEVERPEPSEGMVHVRVLAASVGLPDLFMCRGSYPLTPPYPFTPGQELVGEVLRAGRGTNLVAGERVAAVSGFYLGRGSFAQECLAQGDFAFPVPDEMSDAEAAGFMIPFHTAWMGLVRRAALRAGETVLVLGAAGGTGSAALQLARAIGARVIATAAGPEKVAFCRDLGADLVVDRGSRDIAEAVREATDGRGVDVAYDPVGGSAFRAASSCMAPEGRLLLIGFAAGEWGKPSAAHMVGGNYSVMGVLPSLVEEGVRAKAQRELLDFWRAGALRVPVHQTYQFGDVPRAVAELADGGVCGKIAITISDPRG